MTVNRRSLAAVSGLLSLLALTGCSAPLSEIPPAPADADDAPDLATCLVEDWRLVNATWQDVVNDSLTGDNGVVQSVEGEIHLTLADDGTYTVDYRAWLVVVSAIGGGFETKRVGLDSGTWSLDGDVVTLEQTVSESALESTVIAGQSRIPLPSDPADTGGSLDLQSFTALCAPGELIASISSGDLILLNP